LNLEAGAALGATPLTNGVDGTDSRTQEAGNAPDLEAVIPARPRCPKPAGGIVAMVNTWGNVGLGEKR